MPKGIGHVHGHPWMDEWNEDSEHMSNPIYGPPHLYENGGFHGMAGNSYGIGERSQVNRIWGVVRGPFVGNPLAGRSAGGGLVDAD